MTDATEFHLKLMALRQRQARLPAVMERIKAFAIHSGNVTVAAIDLCDLVLEIEHLQGVVQRQQKDAAEAEREFRREARDIAAEARWEGQEETRAGHY